MLLGEPPSGLGFGAIFSERGATFGLGCHGLGGPHGPIHLVEMGELLAGRPVMTDHPAIAG